MSKSMWTILPATDFPKYKLQWDELNERSFNSILLSSLFIAPLLEVFTQGNEKLVIHGSPEAPTAMGIMAPTSFGVWETFQPSQAPLGCWLQAEATQAEALTKSLLKALPGVGFALGLTQQDPLLVSQPADSKSLQTLAYIQTAHVPVVGTFDEYWQKRGKNLRQNLRKQRNRLEREGVTTRLEKLTSPEAMKGAVTAYGQLESSGWKSEQNTAVDINNDQGQFYSKMLSGFAEQGKAVVYQYFYNDDLVATDLCIFDARMIVILKTTYDETIKISSPAMLMRQDAFEALFAEKPVERIEFYGKVMEWHTKWSEDIRTLFHATHYSALGKFVKAIKP